MPKNRDKITPTPRHDSTQGTPVTTQESGSAPSVDSSPGTSNQGGGDGGNLVKRVIIPVLVIVAIFGGGLVWWTRFRPIRVTVDGTVQTVTIGTTVGQIKADDDIEVTPGNYVSVTEGVLAEGQGYPYSVTVNGAAMGYDQAKDYRVANGDAIDFSNGENRMEPYDTETETIQPKLVMEGNVGTLNYISQWGTPTIQEVRVGRESGERAAGEVKQQGQDCVVTVKDVTPDDGQKLVALTFDDGPGEYTPQFLQVLKDKGAKGTFFCVGSRVDADPEGAKAIVESGSQICSHSYSHLNLRRSDAETVYQELTSSFSAIEKATGARTTAFRPPYGSFTQRTWLDTRGAATVSVRWDVDTEDWRRPGAARIVERALEGVRPGSIILMHDGGGEREQGVEALPQIIDRLREQGYTLVTVSELMQSDSSIPREVATCDETMPEGAVWPTEIG